MVKGKKEMGLTIEQKKKAKELRLKYHTYKFIADQLGVKTHQVKDFCRTKIANIGEIKARKECRFCKKEFIIDKGRLYYCSLECKNKKKNQVYKLKPKASCVKCGELIINKNASAKYCSDKCKIKNCICHICNKTFESINQRKYCSSECIGKSRLIKHNNRIITRSCKYCNETFKTTERKDEVYCNKKCMDSDRRKSHEEFTKEIFEKHNGFIVPLEVYKGANHLIRHLCLKCNTESIKRAGRLVQGIGCLCNGGSKDSKGAKVIEKYLIDNKYRFEKEYHFEDLKIKSYLLYDFAILDNDQNVSLLIEYDGRQHFEPVWGEVELKRTQRHDKLKTEYAKENNIPLIRINYKQKDIFLELKKFYKSTPAPENFQYSENSF